MSLVLDLLILILFAANVYAGWKNGFIRTVLRTCSTLISLIVSYLFSPMLSDFLCEKFLNETVTKRVGEGLHRLMTSGNEAIDIHKLFEDTPQAFIDLLNGFGIELQELQTKFADAIQAGSETLLEDVTAYIAEPIVHMISVAVAFLILFVVCNLALHLACFFLDTVCHLPMLKQMNELLGLLLGVLTGLLMAWGISTVLAELMPALSRLYPNVVSESVIENTFFVRLFAEIRGLSGI